MKSMKLQFRITNWKCKLWPTSILNKRILDDGNESLYVRSGKNVADEK